MPWPVGRRGKITSNSHDNRNKIRVLVGDDQPSILEAVELLLKAQ